MATYGVTKDKLAPGSSNSYTVKSKILIIPVTTSGELSCSWWLLRAYKKFVPLLVPKVAPQGASLSGGASNEDWALFPYYHFLAYSFDTLS